MHQALQPAGVLGPSLTGVDVDAQFVCLFIPC